MNRQETIKWLESLKVEIGKPEHADLWHYEEAIDMAIKALSDPHNCEGCKYEEVWVEACEKCGRPMVDNYAKESDGE